MSNSSLHWAEPRGRFTALFERLVIDWLQAASQQAVADRMGLSWDEAHGIMQRAVKRGLARREAEPIPHIGVDEKAFRKRHRYVTVVNDIDRGRVLYVAEDRKRTSLDGFWSTLTEKQLGSIEADVAPEIEAAVARVFDRLYSLGPAASRRRPGASAGLIESKAKTDLDRLGRFLDAYIAGRANLKPNTRRKPNTTRAASRG